MLTKNVSQLRYKHSIDVEDTNSSHVQIIHKIPDGSRVLDVGCACGDLGVYLQKYKNCTVWGMEYDVKSIEVAISTGAYEDVLQVDLNFFENDHPYRNITFDRIVFGDVLEHLYSPDDVVRNFIPLLGEGGCLIISLPNIAHGSIVSQLVANKFSYMDYGILDRTHLRFYTYESMAKMLAELGLKVETATRTIWDLPGLHPYHPADLVQPSVLSCIAANPHAYVVQYVAEVTPSPQLATVLEKNNMEQLCAFTAEEQQRMGYFRAKHLPASDNNRVISISARVAALRGAKGKISLLKPWLKRITPRPVWNLLKRSRDTLRGARWKHQQRTDAQGYLECLSDYQKQIQQISTKVSSSFVDIASRPRRSHPACPKTIAFYLPQFHPFAENDAWWGRGFTEWSNVTKAVPMFVGHYQPQLPIDLGFYDLRLPEVMYRQVELARLYGIHGFCFHYYWFSGKRLMERPLLNYLADKNLDLPFCLCWANEPWSRRWDGSEDDLLIGQNLQPEDDRQFVEDLLPFLQDVRYITIDGKPVLIVYRPHYWEKERVKSLTANFRSVAREYGLQGLYLVTALSHDFCDDPREWGFDAGVEFPPHMCGMVPRAQDIRFVNEHFNGTVHDMRALVDAEEYMTPSDYTTFKTVFPAWDNTARKLNSAFIFHHSEPQVYKKWLKNTLQYTYRNNPSNGQFVFINAWNEWAEGAHLEPDRKYGYAYLQATADALEEFVPDVERDGLNKG
jgi:methionine biosynthesis protein MetW